MIAKISLRISALQWTNPERNSELLALLQAHPEIEEVALFTGITHPPLPLDTIREQARILSDVLPLYRKIGVKAGINHLATMGHIDENLDNSIQEPWQHLTDPAGHETRGSFCLSDQRVRDYVCQAYRILAKSRPDFIWIDDDVRLQHHPPVNYACFCDLCMNAWSETTGHPWTRETLMAAFSEGSRDELLAHRNAWLRHNCDYLTDAFRLIRHAVDEIDPLLPLGYMSSLLPYSGIAFDEWARELASGTGPQQLPVKWRPGGGFFSDDQPVELLAKMHAIGAQVAQLPVEVKDIQYELENFPYQPLKKSATIVVAEIAAAIGAGCTGVALNIMGTTADPFGEYQRYFDRIQQCAPFFRRAVEVFRRSATEGIGVTYPRNAFATVNLNGPWLSHSGWSVIPTPSELSEIGLPFCYSDAGRHVTILQGDSVLAHSRDEVRNILSGGVVMDCAALGHINAMGLSRLTGFSIQGTREVDTIEQFTSDPLNGPFAGFTRDCRPSFWPEKCYLLEPTHDQSRILCKLVDFKPKTFGPTSGIFENELGGRVAVLGYYPWKMIHSLAKTEQLKTLVRWLSRDTIPAYISSFTRAAIWCRRVSAERAAFMVLNASLDAQDITVNILNAPPASRYIHMDGSEETLTGGSAAGEYTSFNIRKLGAWEAALLI